MIELLILKERLDSACEVTRDFHFHHKEISSFFRELKTCSHFILKKENYWEIDTCIYYNGRIRIAIEAEGYKRILLKIPSSFSNRLFCFLLNSLYEEL